MIYAWSLTQERCFRDEGYMYYIIPGRYMIRQRCERFGINSWACSGISKAIFKCMHKHGREVIYAWSLFKEKCFSGGGYTTYVIPGRENIRRRCEEFALDQSRCGAISQAIFNCMRYHAVNTSLNI
ncbi:hypothetical protein RF11_14333 [Thelohanellus kitauei]|uniref:Uncharacterized protein n=1 Tax=Thelohanellus kitauei TaxID=669202 RepID=A0A0C2IQ56_THEKT|nr:hypothetical protein RF11_14333 [Thelohanellus kitauei]